MRRIPGGILRQQDKMSAGEIIRQLSRSVVFTKA